MPGPTAPWCLIGCHGRAARWGTDLLQLTGRGLPEGAPWPGLRAELPAERLQHEHAVVLLQTEPVTLGPGETWQSGFFAVLAEDHPGATSDADAAVAEGVSLPDRSSHDLGPERSAGNSLLAGARAYLPVRELSEADLDELTRGQRHHGRHVTGGC